MGTDEESAHEKLLPNGDKSESDIKMASISIKNESKRESSEESEGDLRLHDAVSDVDNIEEIQTLVSEEPHLLYERDSEGHTPLHILALAGDEAAPQIAKILIGANESLKDASLISVDRPDILDLQDNEKFTALHYAAKGRQSQLVESLLKWGASPDTKDDDGNTPLHLAAQGNTLKAMEVANLLLSNDMKKTLINSTNNAELTPLHVAIRKLAVDMVKVLLKPKQKYNLNLKNGMGRTVLHYACSSIGESKAACEIVALLLKCCEKGQLNQADLRGKTPLHLATIIRLPKIVKLLIADERVDVFKIDDKQRTALHYAAEDGCYTKGHQCVEALVERKFEKYQEQVKYLFKMEDKQKNTPFMYAAINCPPDTMQKFVGLCPKPQFWLNSVYMTLLYKKSPLALKPLMDKAFTEDQDETHDEEDGIKTDFGIISGYVDPVEKLPQQESKYLKQAVWWDYKAQREILLHPLVQYYLTRKWQKVRKFIYGWILVMIIWLLAYTTLGLTFYTRPAVDHNSTTSEPTFSLEDTGSSNFWPFISSIVMIMYLVGTICNELFELKTVGMLYIFSLSNVLQIVQCVLGFAAVYPIFSGYSGPLQWTKYTTATGILLAFILSMRDFSKLHQEVGYNVEVLRQVCIKILQILFFCSPLCFGFTIGFMIILDKEETLSQTFPAFLKIMVMMTGEFEYNDTFKNDPEAHFTEAFAKMFFFLFLIAVPLSFFNVLTGIALDKVMELREKSKVAQAAKQLEHIYFIESLILRFGMRKIPGAVNCMRRHNVTSAWFNEEKGPVLKFETMIKDKFRKSIRSYKQISSPVWKRLQETIPFPRNDLPSDLLSEIYALASPSTHNSSQSDKEDK